MNLIDKIDVLIVEQDYACDECGHKFHSEWKNKDCKCKKCGGSMSMSEGTYGKEKSKKWFEYRGKIAGVKSEKEMTALLNKMAKELKKDELADLTNQALAKIEKLKKS